MVSRLNPNLLCFSNTALILSLLLKLDIKAVAIGITRIRRLNINYNAIPLIFSYTSTYCKPPRAYFSSDLSFSKRVFASNKRVFETYGSLKCPTWLSVPVWNYFIL